MSSQSESTSDEFSGRLGLIFATIGAAIGTGNIWRFPRMVGANGGGSFLVPVSYTHLTLPTKRIE